MSPQIEHRNEAWHISKSVPIAIIFVFMSQAVGFVWWNAKLEAKVDSNALAITAINTIIKSHKKNEEQHMPYGDKIQVFVPRVELENRMQSMAESLKEIKVSVQKIADKQ